MRVARVPTASRPCPQVNECTTELKANLQEEHLAGMEFIGTVFKTILSPLQKARAIVQSYPFYPDVYQARCRAQLRRPCWARRCPPCGGFWGVRRRSMATGVRLLPRLQIATVLALEKGGAAALESLEAATAAAGGPPIISIPTAYRR